MTAHSETLVARRLRHIACVDDDEDILRITELTLESFGGLKVTTFGTGAAALAGLAEAGPDLILLDVMMPKLDGAATFQEIKKRDDLRHLPVIFLTAKIQPSERRQYEAMGATGVLAKPFDPQTLVRDIERIWIATLPRTEPTPLGGPDMFCGVTLPAAKPKGQCPIAECDHDQIKAFIRCARRISHPGSEERFRLNLQRLLERVEPGTMLRAGRKRMRREEGP